MRSEITCGVLAAVFLCCMPSSLAATPAAPEQSDSYYLFSGANLRVIHQGSLDARYTKWQVWLYPQETRISAYGRPLARARWGVIQGSSAEAVMEQLAASQRLERAYTAVFGPHAWGQFTFSYPIGPIAIAETTTTNEPAGLTAQANLLNSRLALVVGALRASLEAVSESDAALPLKAQFDRARDGLQDAGRLYDRISRAPRQRAYLSLELAQLSAAVSEAEIAVPKVTAILPSVKLPANQSWMVHEERQGSDGTVEAKIAEIGSAAWVRQSWTGGDGSMSGTLVMTIVPFDDIGTLSIWTPALSNGRRWILRLQSASPAGFPQSVTSPKRTTATHSYAAVDLKSAQRFLNLTFDNSAEAEDAYRFFLYHKQRGL